VHAVHSPDVDQRAATASSQTQQRLDGASPSGTATSGDAANLEDTVRVAVKIRPEGSRVFYRGKEIGRTPFTLELLRDERRVFEVGYPGYQSRRLVIDGAEREIAYSLTPNN
jgi:hypothetical protein